MKKCITTFGCKKKVHIDIKKCNPRMDVKKCKPSSWAHCRQGERENIEEREQEQEGFLLKFALAREEEQDGANANDSLVCPRRLAHPVIGLPNDSKTLELYTVIWQQGFLTCFMYAKIMAQSKPIAWCNKKHGKRGEQEQ